MMKSNRIFKKASELESNFFSQLAPRAHTEATLMCPPDEFKVIDVKNPHMEGNLGQINLEKARDQWSALKTSMESLGVHVYLLPPTSGLEDMVFTANPALVGKNQNGKDCAILSNMRHESRRKEVPAFRAWFEEHGYEVHGLSQTSWNFEGHGDGIWHPGKKLLWGGHGYRTQVEVYQEISELMDCPVILLHLTQEHFYHLDTCFCPLNEKSVLYYPPAFSSEGRELIESVFSDPIAVSPFEAQQGFACNAWVHQEHVLIQAGNHGVISELRARDFVVHEMETSEFMKSGGSVFCMKLDVY